MSFGSKIIVYSAFERTDPIFLHQLKQKKKSLASLGTENYYIGNTTEIDRKKT